MSYFMGQFVNLYSVENSNVSVSFPELFALAELRYTTVEALTNRLPIFIALSLLM